ncbi:MAG: DUF1751 domain-containing protein, partial [Terracidiphilus sp.]
MPRIGATPFAFPEFRGATRRLVVVNLVAFFVLYLATLTAPGPTGQIAGALVLVPNAFLHGAIWQPL